MNSIRGEFYITMLALALAVLLSITGCGASWFSCSTEANYKDGEWSYKSCKNQENFKAHVGKDENGNQLIEVETTATTAESAIIAASKGLTAAFESLNKIIPILEKAAMSGS